MFPLEVFFGNIEERYLPGVISVTMPELLVRIARLRRRLQDTDSPEKRLKLSKELDQLLNHYYRIRMNTMNIM